MCLRLLKFLLLFFFFSSLSSVALAQEQDGLTGQSIDQLLNTIENNLLLAEAKQADTALYILKVKGDLEKVQTLLQEALSTSQERWDLYQTAQKRYELLLKRCENLEKSLENKDKIIWGVSIALAVSLLINILQGIFK